MKWSLVYQKVQASAPHERLPLQPVSEVSKPVLLKTIAQNSALPFSAIGIGILLPVHVVEGWWCVCVCVRGGSEIVENCL
mmetsp:Transcript_50572/g.130382  ORF Transcript_50572/g.130382 Transcript_50572/m.130382 type:complete len:80 (+) Transcript_50572:1384-1623(+)